MMKLFSEWTFRSKTQKLVYASFVFLIGLLNGACWVFALMSVAFVGPFVFDFSRIGFSILSLAALAGLFLPIWRDKLFVWMILGTFVGMMASNILTIAWPKSSPFRIAFVFPLIFIYAGSICLVISDWKAKKSSNNSSPAAVPVRFGLGTLAMVVFVLSMGLAIANLLQIPALLTGSLLAFFAILAAIQMIANKIPRGASATTGAIVLTGLVVWIWIANDFSSQPRFAMFVSTFADLIFSLTHLISVGAVFGYFGGTCVAGMFLIWDQFIRFFKTNSNLQVEN